MHRRRLFKMLGLSTLAIVGVMAVSASAAQAKWLVRVNGVSVKSVLLISEYGLTLIIFPGLGFDLHCEDGIGSLLLGTSVNDTVLLHNGWELFLECEVIEFEEVCKVHSPGEKAGSIKMEGSGTGQMSGSKTFATQESSEFTTLVFEGEECPLNEIEETVKGSATFTINNPESEEKSHGVELDDQKLLFGEETVELSAGLEKGKPITGSLKTESGVTWSVKLVNL